MLVSFPQQNLDAVLTLRSHSDESGEIEPIPGCSTDTEPTEEDCRIAREIMETIQNDPEAIHDEEVNRYYYEPLLLRDATEMKVPQVRAE